MATLDELLVRIDASTELLRRELKKGEGQVADFERKTGGILDKADRRWSQLGRGIRTALGFLGVGLSLRGIQQSVLSAVRFGDAIEDASKAANVTAESLQELRFAFGQLGGVTDQQTDTALQRFTKVLGDAANGATTSARVFSALGVEIRGVGGAVRDNEEVLDEVLRQLAGIDSEAVLAARAAELFGREAGPKVAAALSQGIDALDEMRQATPGVLSDENVALAGALNDEFDRMGRTFGGGLKEGIIEVTGALAEMFGLLDDAPAGAVVPVAIRSLESAIAQLERDFADAPPGSRSSIRASIDELEQQIDRLRVQAAQAAGARGFATRSFLTPAGVQVGPGVPFEERDALVAEFAQLERERLAAAELLVTELEKQKQLALGILDVQRELSAADGERTFSIQTKRKAGDTERLIEFQDEYADFLERVQAENLRVTGELGEQWRGLSQTIHFALTDTLADAFGGIETDWEEMLQRMARQLVASGIIKGIGGAIGGPVGAFIAGGLASGGPATAGRSYIVGEDRPEVFRPNLSGTVYPSVGGGGVVINQSIHFDTALEAVDRRIYQAAPMIARATEAKLNESRARGR